MDSPSITPVVLCFSHDFSLMLTRQWLLEKSKCRVLGAMSQPELLERLRQTHVDLVVLCQTLTADECRAALALAQEHSPATRCLVMYFTRAHWMWEGQASYLSSNQSPADFMRTVQQMLRPMPPSPVSSPMMPPRAA